MTPGHSIGPFAIGQKAVDHSLASEFQKIGGNKFQWQDIRIRINDDGLIDLISTSDGHFGDIGTGKTFRQVIENGQTLLFDEFDQVFYLKNPVGLCIEKEYENLTLTELLNSKIQYLTVFDVEYHKRFSTNDDFEEISSDNVASFELKSNESEQFLKTKLRQFKSLQENTRPWWKIW